jgi:hypothetical protein
MEMDARQVQIYRRMTPAERLRAGCALHDLAHRNILLMLARKHPEKSRRELHILTMRRFLGESTAIL